MKSIELVQVTKSFKKQIVLDKIDFVFEKERCYLLVGENGSGKSTLMKCILGLLKLSFGEVIIFSQNIGYVPEKMNFPEFVKVKDFLFQIALIKGLSRELANQFIEEKLKEWELGEAKNKIVKHLSKGMMQKVLIIQALLKKPDLLFFDEPLNGLDFASQAYFCDWIKREKMNKTVIITTHYPLIYKQVSDCTLHLEKGKLYEAFD